MTLSLLSSSHYVKEYEGDSMDTCEDRHEPVAYRNDTHCPVCTMEEEMIGKMDTLAEEKDEIESERDEYKELVDRLTDDLSRYEHIDEKIMGMVKERL